MNPALWKKAVSDAWRQLLVSCVLLGLFGWVFVWLMSQIQPQMWDIFLQMMPKFLQNMIGVPVKELGSRTGQLSVLYVHVITLLVCVGWALGRGSDSISGEIGRGTMDLLVSLPVFRVTIMVVPAVVAAIGAAVLAVSVSLGMGLGLRYFVLNEEVPVMRFVPGAVNLAAMVFCLTGITTLISSWNRDRWRTILLAGGFFVISTFVKMVAQMWAGGRWLRWFTFLSLFQPQEMILLPHDSVWPGWQQDTGLIGLGLLCYLAAGVIFWRRDIPSPL